MLQTWQRFYGHPWVTFFMGVSIAAIVFSFYYALKTEAFQSLSKLEVRKRGDLLEERIHVENANPSVLGSHLKQKSSTGFIASAEILKFIASLSPHQKLNSEKILHQTLIYAIEERDQYDPELVSFVRSLIVPPTSHRLPTYFSSRSHSELGQDIFIDNLLSSKRNGFFVEAGAADGVSGSNTLFFEGARNWTGLLVEAIPEYFQSILLRMRNAYVINCCLTKSNAKVAKMLVAEGYSGRSDVMSPEHKNLVREMLSKHGKSEIFVYVPCFSLNTILRALNITKVDYLSLDIEGAEVDVLSGLDFIGVTYSAISVESTWDDASEKIRNILLDSGFEETESDKRDAFYVNKNKTLLD